MGNLAPQAMLAAGHTGAAAQKRGLIAVEYKPSLIFKLKK
jgi:hypothetical protein